MLALATCAAAVSLLRDPGTQASGPAHRAGLCNADDDCSLLGVCSGGVCKCDPGWTGADCGAADLLPMDPSEGYINATAASWGGRPVFAEGRWHLFATEIQRNCPLILFMNNSAVVRAEADSPQGPYTHKELVLPPFHHNPQIFGPTPDGYYLLFSIGNDADPSTQIGCEVKVPRACTLRNNSFCRGAHMPSSNGRVDLSYAQSVHGPWTSKVILPYGKVGFFSFINWFLPLSLSYPARTVMHHLSWAMSLAILC